MRTIAAAQQQGKAPPAQSALFQRGRSFVHQSSRTRRPRRILMRHRFGKAALKTQRGAMRQRSRIGTRSSPSKERSA